MEFGGSVSIFRAVTRNSRDQEVRLVYRTAWFVTLILALSQPTLASGYLHVGTLSGPGQVTANGIVCGYVDNSATHSWPTANGVNVTYNGSDHKRLYPQGTSCPKTVAFWYASTDVVHSGLWPFAKDQRNHICQYLLAPETLEVWRSRHPGMTDPILEDVFPETTTCPTPPDDHTPLDLMTPAQHEALLAETKLFDCRYEEENSSEYKACREGHGRVGWGTSILMMDNLAEFKATRHWVGGVIVTVGEKTAESLCKSVDGGNSFGFNVGITTLEGGSHHGDQFFCIARSTGEIYVGQQYTNLPLEPLTKWRARSGALTDKGVVLNPLLQQPAKNSDPRDEQQIKTSVDPAIGTWKLNLVASHPEIAWKSQIRRDTQSKEGVRETWEGVDQQGNTKSFSYLIKEDGSAYREPNTPYTITFRRHSRYSGVLTVANNGATVSSSIRTISADGKTMTVSTTTTDSTGMPMIYFYWYDRR